MAGKDAILKRRRRDANAGVLSAAAEEGSKHVFLKLDQLIDRADNRDVDAEHVGKLADSIEENGLGQPLLVRSVPGEVDRYELIAGQHRREAYRTLQQRHPGDARFERVECILRTDMPDDVARKLMYETNVACLHGDVLYAAEVYQSLAEDAAEMREEDPSLSGVRTSEIVAELATEISGEAVSSREVERTWERARDVRAVIDAVEGGSLAREWAAEFEASTVLPSVCADLSAMPVDVQSQVHRGWEASGRRKDWLKIELKLRTGGADRVAVDAASSVGKSLELLERAIMAGADRGILEVVRGRLAALGEDEEKRE